MKPRILFVVHLPPPVHGVTLLSKQVIASETIAAQFGVRVLPLRFSESVDEIRSASLAKVGRSAITGLRLLKELALKRPDAVYFTFAPTGVAFYRDCAYAAAMKAFGVRRIFHIHARGIASHLDAGWSRRMYRWLFSGARIIHLSSRLEHDTAPIVDASQIVIVPNGIEDVRPAPRIVREGPARILFLSNMIREKGPLDLLEALRHLAARGIDFEATFVGARFHDGCVEEFSENVERYGLARRVRYVGPIYGEEKLALFREHDIFAFPTYNDAFPLVVLEAMQQGLPVVSTDEGAIPEMVVDGETGFVVPKRDTGALAARLEQLVVDPNLRARLGAKGRDRYVAHFTAEQFEQNLASALASFVA